MTSNPQLNAPVNSDTLVLQQIKLYKQQLQALLDKNYVDPTMIIGLSNLFQSNFTTWIKDNFDAYYQLAESSDVNGQIEFTTIKFIDTIWINFHYPIIKFYKQQHIEISEKKEEDKTKFKPVELRKINDSLVKFVKKTAAFYMDLLEHFSINFANALVPSIYLDHYNFSVKSDAKYVGNSHVQANLLYVMHKCLLCLGDLTRHRATIETTYLLPNLSTKNYYNFKRKDPKKLLPFYLPAITVYRLCILLLPSLNEPYNHIGMIHNMSNNKITAIYWFLRANFTRIGGYKLGLFNLKNHLSKGWVKQELSFFLKERNADHGSITDEQLNLMFTGLICFHYLPDKYHMTGDRFFANLKVAKLEFIFLSLNFNENIFKKNINLNRDPVDDFYLFQLTLLICFRNLIDGRHFKRLLNKYLEFYFKSVLQQGAISNVTSILTFLRLLLNWLHQNERSQLVSSNIKLLARVMNKLVSEKPITVEDLSSKPVRNYYFSEDVLFKDFRPVGYQLTDFNDGHLFEANNINLLNHDYRSLVVDGIPIFLDNVNVQNNTQLDLVYEVNKYENASRALAVLGLFYRLFTKIVRFDDHFTVIDLRKERSKRKKATQKIELVKPTQVDDKVTEKMESESEEAQSEEAQSEEEGSEQSEEEEEEEEDSEDELNEGNEIEDFIRFHTTQLQSQMQSEQNQPLEQSTQISNSLELSQPNTSLKDQTWNVEVSKTATDHYSSNGSFVNKNASVVQSSVFSQPSQNAPHTNAPVNPLPYIQPPMPSQAQGFMPNQTAQHMWNQYPQYQYGNFYLPPPVQTMPNMGMPMGPMGPMGPLGPMPFSQPNQQAVPLPSVPSTPGQIPVQNQWPAPQYSSQENTVVYSSVSSVPTPNKSSEPQ